MGFFDPIEATDEGAPRVRRKAWLGPPENEFGVLVPIQVELVRTDEVAAAVVGVIAYSTGFTVRMMTRVSPAAAPATGHPMIRPWATGKDQFRFGIAFADGRKATNVHVHLERGDDPPPIWLSLQGGSGGGGLSWDVGYWVYPIPPPGAVTFAAEWKRHRVSERVHEVDGTPIREAAARSERLWEDDRPFGNPGGVTFGVAQSERVSKPDGEPTGSSGRG